MYSEIKFMLRILCSEQPEKCQNKTSIRSFINDYYSIFIVTPQVSINFPDNTFAELRLARNSV